MPRAKNTSTPRRKRVQASRSKIFAAKGTAIGRGKAEAEGSKIFAAKGTAIRRGKAEAKGSTKQRRRSPQKYLLEPVVRELYPPGGIAPEGITNPQIVQAIGKALRVRGVLDKDIPKRKAILRRVGKITY